MTVIVQRGRILVVFLLLFVILAEPVTAYTTELTVRRYAVDGLTPINETTKTYQWMEANLPVYGDGNTYYYYQGPIFEGEWEANYGGLFPEYRTDWGGTPPAWPDSEEIWDRYWNGTAYEQKEETNWAGKNLGKLKGTDLKDLCNLVGGLSPGQIVRVIAADNAPMNLTYSMVYTPTTELGPYVITWWSVGAGESGATSGYTGPDYTNGMRATFFADNSSNPSGEHVAGLGDQAEGIPEEYWYYYGGDYPSMGGWTLKYVNRIYVFSNDPVPPPIADFSANTKTGKIINGNFETASISPWSSNGATIYTGTTTPPKRLGNASASLAGLVGNPAWIQQDVDFDNIGSIYFWRYSFGGLGKYLEVLVDDTVVANYTESSTVAGRYEMVDISSYHFTGNHTLKFKATSEISGTFTVYLDDITDYGPGTSGDAPLTVQFKDLSTKMEDPAHTSWLWDFYNNGTATNTERNPLFTYTADGTYTVKLTVTNAGGSDSETKTGYIIVGAVEPPITSFTATPTTGPAPLTVQFNDTSTNSPTSWSWAYRNATDGWTQFSTTRNASYTFPRGTFDINLTTTNVAGSDDEIKTGYITVNPVANFTAKMDNVANGGFETGTFSGWTQVGTTIDNTIHYSGTYSAKISNSSALTSYVQQSVNLTNVNQLLYYFQITKTDNGGHFDIYIDSTNVASYSSPVTTWTQGTIDVSGYTGQHVVKFAATSGQNKKETTAYVDNVTVLASCPDGVSGDPPLTVYFMDTSVNYPNSWAWTFGDEGTSTLQNPVHTYTAAGIYTVSLTATNTSTGSDTETKTGYVNVGTVPSPPVTAFSANVTSGTAPLPVKFTDESENTPDSWRWAYRNATVGWTQFSTDQNPEYTFPAGTYDINLTATNAGGSDDEIKIGFIVVSGTTSPPVAGFSATPLSGTAPLLVAFTDTSTNTPTSWRWAYKNATAGWTQFATSQNPSFTFPAGTYDVNLTATNAGGSDDEIKTGYITVTPPTPYIDISISGSISDWNFGSGTNEDPDSIDMTVDTNMDSWSVSVQDALDSGKPAGTEGKLAEWSSGSGYVASGEYLFNALKVKSGTGSYVTLSGSSQPLQSGSTQGILPFDIGIRQDIVETDPALSNDHYYHIVITFTGAAA